MRRAQAAGTRQRICDAARELFVLQGYPATTLQQVADRAGVALPTVTGAFSTKRILLDEVLRASVRDAGGPRTPLAERLREVLQAPDPHVLLAAHACLIAEANHGARDLFEILRKAAAADPELELQRKRGAADRRRDQYAVASELARRGALRPNLSLVQATDLLWLYSSADVYWLLVTDRRWSLERFTTWLGQTLADALLGGNRPD